MNVTEVKLTVSTIKELVIKLGLILKFLTFIKGSMELEQDIPSVGIIFN